MKINLVNCWSELHLTGPTFICSNFPVIFIEQDVIGCRGACKKSRSTLSIFQLRHTSWRLILSILSYFKGHFLGIGRMNMWGLKVYVWKGPIPNKDNIISMRNSHLVNYYKRWILGTPACWGRYVEYETCFWRSLSWYRFLWQRLCLPFQLLSFNWRRKSCLRKLMILLLFWSLWKTVSLQMSKKFFLAELSNESIKSD